MENVDVSRRETFRLARFGTLLALSLGIAEQGMATQHIKGTFDSKLIKGELGGVLIKLYGVEANGYELLKTAEIKGLALKTIKLGGVEFTVKFIKGNLTLASLTEILQKQNNR